MSTNNNLEASDNCCCASCGIAELDDIKLMDCDDCDLVRYCSDKCQQDHRPQHDAICKERAAELRDEILFRQPERTHMGDCPICFLPLPPNKISSTILMPCCSKTICGGCAYANFEREVGEKMPHKCPFCRKLLGEEDDKNTMKRAEVNDPVAIREIGKKHYSNGDYDTAFKSWTKAVGLGDVEAHFRLSIYYGQEEGVEKDEKKEVYHLEEAAIAGHHKARFSLGRREWKNGRFEIAVKHWIIAANLGLDASIIALKECYTFGKVSKEDFAAALRAHQAAVNATKSPHRETAVKIWG